MSQLEGGSRAPERAFRVLALVALILPLVVIAVLFGKVFSDAWPRLEWEFLTSFPSRKAAIAGIKPALVGTLYLMGLTAVIAIPIGVSAAIYLEEYAPANRWTRLVELNISTLAGVPSIIYGLLGLEIFVRVVGLGRSLLAGAATLALLLLPMVIIATLTGVILSLSRAIGETAPLITIGALTYVAFVPKSIDDPFTALPIQIFNWVSRPQAAFHVNAAAGIVVLLAAMLLLNGLAIWLRFRLQRKVYQ